MNRVYTIYNNENNLSYSGTTSRYKKTWVKGTGKIYTSPRNAKLGLRNVCYITKIDESKLEILEFELTRVENEKHKAK